MSEQLSVAPAAFQTRPTGFPAYFLLILSVGFLASPLADPAISHAQEQPTKEVYQDFRNKRPLLESLRLAGPDIASATKAEDEGLRITLPAERDHHWPVEVVLNFPATGDFEMTGTYELLAGERPAKGYGVGVSLMLADNEKRKKFAKVSRLMRAKEGSVHLTEYWTPYQVKSTKTEAKAGQLRLVRVGPSLRYLVSDGPGQAFREIWYQKNFGAEDLHYVRFGVTDSGEPGNPVDARLIDLRIRMGEIVPDKALEPATLPAPAPLAEPAPVPTEPTSKSGTKTWLAILLFLGLGVTLAFAIGLSAWLLLRNRYPSTASPANEPAKSETTSATVAFACSGCGKNLKANKAMAGKKVKCSQCGNAVLVPKAVVDEADETSD